ncbi:MAG: ABC transporter permease [Clostridia bacterium]|nr:ABC transporter permease [Clostridia bacterium]
MDMKKINNINDIPAEKFRLANREDTSHDKKLETKPLTYFQDAFRRFCKNKGAVVGAVVISILVLFALIAPLFTPFTPGYHDKKYMYATPKLPIAEELGLDFWDGYKKKTEVNYMTYLKDYALGLELGRDVIKDGEYTVDDNGMYTYRYDTYHGVGFGKYKKVSFQEYEDIQRYQRETGRQVLYPVVALNDRPTHLKNAEDANIYYVTENPAAATIRPKLDADGNIQVNYWKYKEGTTLSALIVPYDSQRIEGEDGVQINGETYYYVYGRNLGGSVEVRADYYEYYTYYHTQVEKDGIEEPLFLFGTTEEGKDIFACLSYGARFSFIFAILVAVVNLVVGVIWGSISGYYGGKLDLAMERFCEVLGAVPTMIVITLLKYHLGGTTPQALILFIAFFATGWIGMAGRTRMQFYRFKNQEYVLTARTLGAKDRRIMFKHIFPNAIGTLVTSCALIIPSMIYSETSLSYLGIINLEAGERTSVGTLIAAGQKAIIIPGAAYVAIFPCVFLIMLMLSFNLFGNGLRDAFNPSLRGTEG